MLIIPHRATTQHVRIWWCRACATEKSREHSGNHKVWNQTPDIAQWTQHVNVWQQPSLELWVKDSLTLITLPFKPLQAYMRQFLMPKSHPHSFFLSSHVADNWISCLSYSCCRSTLHLWNQSCLSVTTLWAGVTYPAQDRWTRSLDCGITVEGTPPFWITDNSLTSINCSSSLTSINCSSSLTSINCGSSLTSINCGSSFTSINCGSSVQTHTLLLPSPIEDVMDVCQTADICGMLLP